ncbi:MAG TPA: PIG-L family deacetylase [Acidimicrobiales bacterium]|nr:PIG-L family deacetylase [Acidimicrobiales bacterium]
MSAGRGSVVFLHAHPDDEAIFTGGTMALLARRGWRLVLVVATHGEHGEVSDRVGPEVPLAVRRVAETAAAAELLGVQRVEFLGYHDSGMPGHPANEHERAFARSPVDEAAERLEAILVEEEAEVLVTYDEQGVYGHPDHIQVHRVGMRAARMTRLPTVYESTVDREYLHFVETHLVVEASRSGPQPERVGLGLAGTRLGLSTVEIDATVDVRPVLEVKRRAMAAHSSQIPETSSAMQLPVSDFAAVYGYEWYARRGPAGPIDDL